MNDITRAREGALTAVVDGFVWDSRRVEAGYDWSPRAIWVIPMDVALLQKHNIDRHFRMVRTMCSSVSTLVVVHVSKPTSLNHITLEKSFSDFHILARNTRFVVEYSKSLAEIGDELKLPYVKSEFANNLHVSVLSPAAAPANAMSLFDQMSEVTPSAASSARSSLGDCEQYEGASTKTVQFSLSTAGIPSRLRNPDYSVILIGSEKCLGCWDPSKAKKMGSIDVLIANVDVVLHNNAQVEYKYAIVSDEGVVTWEDGCNRKLRICDMVGTEVSDEWN